MNQARLRSGPEANRLCVLAIEKYQAAILLNEENQTPLANLGITAYFQADNTASPDTAAHLQRAEECLRKALQLRPGYAWARVQLASVLRFRARFEGTERALAAISEGIEQCQLALGRRVDYEYAISVGSQLLRAKPF
jgi:tetratricopeptide (TPR) repeat protein